MKSIIIGLLAITSASAFSIECKFPSNVGDFSKVTLTITSEDEYLFTGPIGEDLGHGAVENVILLGQDDFKNSSELQSYMTRSGIKKPENFLNAKIFVTDSNEIGDSGLLVFFGGNGAVLAKAYVLAPIDRVIKCTL